LRVETAIPSLLCLVAWETFEGVVLRNPEVGLRRLRVLGERIGVLETRLADLAYRKVPARLAGAILRLVEGEGWWEWKTAGSSPATRIGSWPP
jgi:CRP-like cAMP-binding protein